MCSVAGGTLIVNASAVPSMYATVRLSECIVTPGPLYLLPSTRIPRIISTNTDHLPSYQRIGSISTTPSQYHGTRIPHPPPPHTLLRSVIMRPTHPKPATSTTLSCQLSSTLIAAPQLSPCRCVGAAMPAYLSALVL